MYRVHRAVIGSVGVSRDCPSFFEYSVLSQEWVNLYTNFKFCTHIHRVDRNKTPLKIRKRNRGRTQRLSKIFRAPIYMYKAHHAVIFTVAQLSSMNLTLESNLFREFWVRDLLLQ